MTSKFPVDQIWTFNQEGYEGDQNVVLDSEGVALSVKRLDFFSYLQAL